MIWNSSYNFFESSEKCIYGAVMDALWKCAREKPEKPVLVSAEDPSHSFTHMELINKTHSLEAFLHKNGFKEGDVGSTALPSNIEMVPFMLAVLGRGGIYSGMAPGLTAYEMEYHLKDCGASFVLTTKSLLEKVQFASKNLKMKIVGIGEENSETITSWDDALKSKEEAPTRENDKDAVAAMPYSSGTTGLRKGVLLSHSNILTSILNYRKHVIELAPQPHSPNGDTLWNHPQILVYPTYHISGMFQVILNIVAESTTVMIGQYDLKTLLDNIQLYKAQNLFATPPVVLDLVKDPMTKNYDVTSMKYLSTVGAGLPKSLADEFAKMYPHCLVTQHYAMTECLYLGLPLCKRGFSGSAGCVAPGMEAKIVDTATGDELGVGERGEILVKGPSVTKGYHKRPDATADALKEGWLPTGDIGYFNENCELSVVDRIKEFIKVNGLQVAPAEFESVLSSDPRVRDVGVVGLPHSTFSEVAGIFIVKNDESLKEEDVFHVIKEHLAAYKWLGSVVKFVDDIPKLASGKILRRELKKMYAN